MATGLLERTETVAKGSTLKAYGKLTGEAEPAVMTEEQKAFQFNSKISDNYQKLINPDLNKADDFAEAEQQSEYTEPVYQTPEAYAYAMLYPEKEKTASFEPSYATAAATPTFTHQRVTEDLFRVDSPINRAAFQVYEPATEQHIQEETPAQNYADDASDDLKPTATTIQYQNQLYREEKRETAKEKSRFTMTAKGKVLMCVYAVVVAVVLALIVINTRVLGNLGTSIEAHEKALATYRTEYAQLQENIEQLTDDASIIQRAEELGMVR